MLQIKNNQDIWITRGDDAYLNLEIKQQSFPYENYEIQKEDSVVLSVRRSKEDNNDEENPILFQTILNDGYFYISSENTQYLDFGSYVYDVQITFSNGDINTVIGPSIFKILPEVTY